jgi:hypothetical protein
MTAMEVLAGRPISAMPEADLIRGYSAGLAPVIRVVPCACGGRLAAPVGDWDAISAAVQTHRETQEHRAWQLRCGLFVDNSCPG